MGEYRLLPQSLETAIPALLLTGAARAFWTMTYRLPQHIPITHRQTDVLLCLIGALLTAACICFRSVDDETISRVASALEVRYLPLLTINLLATALAVRTGKSILVPIKLGDNDEDRDEDEVVSNMLALLTMTGLTGVLSTSKLHRSFTSWPQFVFFSFTVALLSSGHLAALRGCSWRSMYDVVLNEMDLQSAEGQEEFETAEDFDDMRIALVQQRRKFVLLRIVLIAIALPTLWISYLTLNFSQRVHQKTTESRPILDLAYTPDINTEVVISMFKEPIEQVAHLVSTLRGMSNIGDAKIHIYIKDVDANLSEVKEGTGAHEVTALPNIGREGETFLKHILGSWDTLAKQTIFLQADVHNPRELYPRIRDYFVPGRTGMLSLGWSGQVCNCEDCGDRFNFWDTTHLFPGISNRINNATKCDKVLLSYKGQFIASAKRIRGVDKSVYQDLRDAFVNQDSWAHQEEYLQGRPDSMSAPFFGFTMERMWNLLFQCNSMEIAWRCPTLLSGNRIGGNIEDCQCLDPAS